MRLKVEPNKLSISRTKDRFEVKIIPVHHGKYQLVLEKYSGSSNSLYIHLTEAMTPQELMKARKELAVRLPTFWRDIRKEAKK